MPIYTEPDGGTGGGTTSSVCQISPSDNIAVLSNYGNRISDIERFLSRLVAADVHANNLSELADNMGNLINGAVMMPYSPNDSWSGVGGSIAVPEGFTGTFISGGVTTIWSDGVVTYEATPHGIVTGGGVVSYMLLFTETKTSFFPDFEIARNRGEFTEGMLEDSSTVRIPSNGLYKISFTGDSAVPATTTVFYEFLVRDEADATVYQVINEYRNTDGSTRAYGWSLSQPFWMEADWSVLFRLSTSLVSISDCHGAVMKMGSG